MSAFVVENNHINSIMNFCYNQNKRTEIITDDSNYTLSNTETLTYIGKILLHENIRSVNHRYDDKYEIPEYKFIKTATSISATQCLKALHCLEYQSCETSDYEQSSAYKITNEIKDIAIVNLPEYDKCKWDIM